MPEEKVSEKEENPKKEKPEAEEPESESSKEEKPKAPTKEDKISKLEAEIQELKNSIEAVNKRVTTLHSP